MYIRDIIRENFRKKANVVVPLSYYKKYKYCHLMYMQKKREFILKIFARHEIDNVARTFIWATILTEICIWCKVIFEGRASFFIHVPVGKLLLKGT